MKWGLKKDPSAVDAPQALPESLEICQEKKDFFLSAIQALLQFINDFALDVKELKSDVFKQQLGELEAEFVQNPKLKKTVFAFRKHRKRIGRFIDRQNRYLTEREKELKDIIDLLARAMVTLDTDNQQYHQRIYRQSEKIEQVTRLDDIKKLKHALILEIDNIRKTVRAKQNRDSKQLKSLSKQVSALNLELRKAKVDSVTDGLTGVFNRKALDQHLDSLVEQNTRAPAAFALLMVDIDGFKAINDAYGHPTGDRVLLALAQKCQGLIRNDDFIARYGGEEFVIVLPNASLTNATKKAQRICASVGDTRYALNDNNDVHILNITVSIGISVYQNGDTAESVIARADRALYLAKKSGKNRVVSEKELICDDAAEGR
ncbi:MAG: GGDEF domain-containing protein [Deltaproteobacteria bacterium]|jgi:diguanylate cyclase|nr:GGDEF domain-containing protein [Deltaproteobacteria bacterium]